MKKKNLDQQNINIKQLNCNHAKRVEAQLSKRMEHTGHNNQVIYLLQEPYYFKEKIINNLNKNFTLFHKKEKKTKNMHTCLYKS